MKTVSSSSSGPFALVRAALIMTILALGVGLAGAGAAQAAHSQVTMVEADGQLINDPVGTVAKIRALGIGAIRLAIRWQELAPATRSFTPPRNFTGTDPADYAAAAWQPYDAIVRAATAAGVRVDLDVAGGAPLWATGPGMPRTRNCPCHNWAPNAARFGQFVRAVATRYSGNYNPTARQIDIGDPGDLPRVSLWSIWNEPDYGPSLAPQSVPGLQDVEYAPQEYRGLVDQAWSALHATGHGFDTILWGELAPRGTVHFGDFNGMTPLAFVRALYCVGRNYRPLSGLAAEVRGCPTTAAGVRSFRGQHPALFAASGVSVHAYMRWYAPNDEVDYNPEYASLAEIGNLTAALRRTTGAYGAPTSFPLWNTEFGYITSGPKRRWVRDRTPYASQTTAAYYDNWAEYLSWRNPNIMSFDQYLLQDALPALQSNDYGGFASGLLSFTGTPKPGYAAFRLPVYMPTTTASSPASALELWGAARPAHYAELDVPHVPESVDVLFAPAGVTSFSVLQTVPITDGGGYFDTRISVPSSGTILLRYRYPADPLLAPAGTAVFSRHLKVTVR